MNERISHLNHLLVYKSCQWKSVSKIHLTWFYNSILDITCEKWTYSQVISSSRYRQSFGVDNVDKYIYNV